MLARTTYEPWSLLGDFRRDMERLFGETATNTPHYAEVAWVPAVDIKEDEDAYVLRADVPGVDAKDIDVTLEDGILTIKGERKSETKDEREGYKRIERVSGSFFRRFSLPDTTDAENISAKSDKGVLEVRIPKQPKAQPKKITVQS